MWKFKLIIYFPARYVKSDIGNNPQKPRKTKKTPCAPQGG